TARMHQRQSIPDTHLCANRQKFRKTHRVVDLLLGLGSPTAEPHTRQSDVAGLDAGDKARPNRLNFTDHRRNWEIALVTRDNVGWAAECSDHVCEGLSGTAAFERRSGRSLRLCKC